VAGENQDILGVVSDLRDGPEEPSVARKPHRR
jgi:hypothetical protein